MRQVVYVSSLESQQIHVWQLDIAGSLKLLQVINAPWQVQPMTMHPKKSYLYVGIRPVFSIVSYRIQTDGTLYQASIASLPASSSYVSTDLLGRYLFSVSYSGNCISVSHINDDGLVTMPPIQQIRGAIAPHSANITPDNQYLLIPCLKEDCIRLFKLGINGQLMPHIQEVVNTAVGSGPRHIAFHPNGQYAYCVNELDGTVNILSILKNGSKYCVTQTLDIMPVECNCQRWASDIHITPNGLFLYTSERTMNLLTIFKVGAEGRTLSVVGYQSTDALPRSFNIDHSGRFIVSASQSSDHIISI
ncbi:6-phosphogluconolactonase, cycloisomerase 2 family [Serratia symbiotica str. 'Cinara cedri']|nr:6-phosphogluconolactonase, cycloisomerase 2 family [Serratia symbiotica str. 'Cinara cedri']